MKPPSRILIVRRDNIGDLVCTTPAIAALRKQYPKAEIAALVNSYNAEVLRNNPSLDHVFVYQKLKHAVGLTGSFMAVAKRLKLIVELRSWKPDVTILARASYERHGLKLARQIGAKNIIGYLPDILVRCRELPDIKLATPDFNALHEVEAINGLLKPLGIDDGLGPLQVFPNEQAASDLKQRLPPASKRIAIHISAREPERRWGIERFISLIAHVLKTQPEIQVLLFWSPGKENDPHHPGDDEAASHVIQKVGNDRLIPIPAQNLTELIAALSLCDIFVGADGGAMHIAAALNKMVVALFENLPNKYMHWYPWRVRNVVVHSKEIEKPSVEWIKQSQVEEALWSLL